MLNVIPANDSFVVISVVIEFSITFVILASLFAVNSILALVYSVALYALCFTSKSSAFSSIVVTLNSAVTTFPTSSTTVHT